ncbi:MAG: hypothetical protein KAT15_06510 [Bacteroidales bacterium]|nr:hypothetical protein [Bacteroidales bacterium]
MKKLVPYSILCLTAAFLFSTTLLAQEKTEVTIKVTKDGKVVKDTTYQFNDAAEAKHAIKMMEVLSEDREHVMEYNYTMAHKHGDQSKTMVYISEDGETTTIKEFHGDSLVWIEEGGDGDQVKVIRKKIKAGEHPHGEKVIRKKEVKVMVLGDEHGTWHVEGDELEHVDEDVYIFSGDDDVKVEVQKIIEEHGDGENIKIIVVKKKLHEDCVHDHDEDCDHEGEEVEIEIEKKVKKKSN